jgi:hypothetical protein
MLYATDLPFYVTSEQNGAVIFCERVPRVEPQYRNLHFGWKLVFDEASDQRDEEVLYGFLATMLMKSKIYFMFKQLGSHYHTLAT